MKRATWAALSAAGLCSTVLLSPAHAQVINLKVANFFPPPSKQSKITQVFFPIVRSGSGS